jgi:hypothetical protein
VISFAVAAPRDLQTSQSDVGSFDKAKPVSPQRVLFLTSLAWPCVDPAPVIHYVLNDNLEQVDVAFVNRAEVQMNMAVYGLMD